MNDGGAEEEKKQIPADADFAEGDKPAAKEATEEPKSDK